MQTSVLIFIQDYQIYIRVLAILIMLVSFSLILTAVVMFGKAQNKPGHPLDNVPKPTTITDHPCIVFSGVAALNLVLSTAVFSLSCISSKVNHIIL
jgi:predicted tellurium resistance membrane protein TerC